MVRIRKVPEKHRLNLWPRCRVSRLFSTLLAAVALQVLSGCTLLASGSHERLLEHAGWTQSTLTAAGFQLSLFSPALPGEPQRFHIYIGGDGRAFVARQSVARDPTGTDHLGLRLAIADPAPSVFLARPCYYGGASTLPCEPTLWTLARYSPRVVGAVVEAISEIARRYPRAQLTLVGYSGGGVIALLAARQLERVERVITVAAPLDTTAWTHHHGYTSLAPGSNPAAERDWPSGQRQLHLLGVEDVEVPATIVASYHARTGLVPPRSVVVPMPGYDHYCCWDQTWPAILASLADR